MLDKNTHDLGSYEEPVLGSRVDGWDANPVGQLQLTGAEAPLSEEFQSILDTLHGFSTDVIRPAGIQLDRMSADAAAADDSPLWPILNEFQQLGLGVEVLMGFEPEESALLTCLVMEKLGLGNVTDDMVEAFVAAGPVEEVYQQLEPLRSVANHLCPTPPMWNLPPEKVQGYSERIGQFVAAQTIQ